jgi:hypothetical protein
VIASRLPPDKGDWQTAGPHGRIKPLEGAHRTSPDDFCNKIGHNPTFSSANELLAASSD